MSHEIPSVSPEEFADFCKRASALKKQYEEIKEWALGKVDPETFVNSPFRDIWGNLIGVLMLLDLNMGLISQNKDGILRSLQDLEMYFLLLSQYPAFKEMEIRDGYDSARYVELLQKGGRALANYILECKTRLEKGAQTS